MVHRNIGVLTYEAMTAQFGSQSECCGRAVVQVLVVLVVTVNKYDYYTPLNEILFICSTINCSTLVLSCAAHTCIDVLRRTFQSSYYETIVLQTKCFSNYSVAIFT